MSEPQKRKRGEKKKKSKSTANNSPKLLEMIIVICVVSIVIVAFGSRQRDITVVAVTPEPTATPASPLERAEIAAERGRFAEAAREYTTVIERAGNDTTDLYLKRAYAYYRMGDEVAALSDYRRITDQNPDASAAAWLGQARIQHERFLADEDTVQLDIALTYADAALRVSKAQNEKLSLQDHRLLGDIYYDSREYRFARDQYKQYLESVDDPGVVVLERMTFLDSLE